MIEFLVALVSVSSVEQGQRIADALVSERLAACVNIVGPVLSVYEWKGKLEREQEWLLVIKSRGELFASLEQRVRDLHSYEVAEVIALPIIAGSTPYLEWLSNSMKTVPKLGDNE